MFSLNGPASLVRSEDSERPSLAAACCLLGLPWVVHSSSPGQKETYWTTRAGKELEIRKNKQKKQKRKVREAFLQSQILQLASKAHVFLRFHVILPQNSIQQVRFSPGSSAKRQKEKGQGWRKAATHSKHAAKGWRNMLHKHIWKTWLPTDLPGKTKIKQHSF